MTRPRTPLPTDLVALVSFQGKVYPNEARTWDRLGTHQQGPHPLESAIEQWFSFATGRHTWVSVRGATPGRAGIRGLVSARPRAKRSAWEVECLINADEDESVCLSLLSRMVKELGKTGAERIFIRLDAHSPLLDLMRQAGFFPYCSEHLFRRDGPAGASAPDGPWRKRLPADSYGIFQLYNALAPANVRSIEGANFREWQAAQERWPTSLVLEEEGIITAWLRADARPSGRLLTSGQLGRFSLLVHPDYTGRLDALLQAALSCLAGKQPLFCHVPAYADHLAAVLRQAHFTPAGQYVLLAKRLAKPVEELTAEQIGKAIPAS